MRVVKVDKVAESGTKDSVLKHTSRKAHNVPQAREISTIEFTKRRRMSPEQRRLQIMEAAAKTIAAKGFWGMSVQDIADEIGITEAALYHYIRNKNDLLGMIIEELYDSKEADEYIYGNACIVVGEQPYYFFPQFCLNNILFNVKRPEMVKLFSILNAEALNPEHPAHTYFINRQHKYWSQISAMNWVLPEPYAHDINAFYHLWTLAMSAMDGLQLRWLADASADLMEEWFAFCDVLFPSDMWEGFTTPEDYRAADEEFLRAHSMLVVGSAGV